jgi:hypothetical protein
VNPKQQQIAIAEACGWKTETYHHKGGIPASTHWVSPSGKIKNDIPNYPHDLNAMHEAEKVLNNPEHMQKHAFNNYAYLLIEMCKHQCNAAFATAAQRAEALLKTLNLWTEEDAQ